MNALSGTDDGMAAIGARFAVAAGFGAAAGGGAPEAAAAAAGLPMAPRRVCRPVFTFNLPPGLLTGTSIGAYLDLPMQFGPRTGWYWDVLSLSAYGFTAGAIAVTKNAPLVTPAGNPFAIEPVASFVQAGIVLLPRKGEPMLDPTERLVFTVTTALTGFAQISGMVTAIPAEQVSRYLA